MLLKTLLNRVEKFNRFVVQAVAEEYVGSRPAIVFRLRARARSRPICSGCGKPSAANGHQSLRYFQYVPLWGIPTYLAYAPRRVSCKQDGAVVEQLPWAEGKERLTKTFRVFLAQWARRLSWLETAQVFQTSWDSVVASVRYVVAYGLEHRSLDGITQAGIDEIAVYKGHSGYLTVVYQLNRGMRRLLWIGRDRTTETLNGFFEWFGLERTQSLEYICSDMWKPYLKSVREHAKQALHILDRFHIMRNMNEALDNVRKGEMRRLGKAGKGSVLYRSRWALLKRPENLSMTQAARLSDLLRSTLSSVKAYLLKEEFQRFWEMRDPVSAEIFLESWVKRVHRTKLRSMHWMARKLEKHKPLILNWFQADGELAMGAVEGLNLKAKLIIRKSYGFKSVENVELALYHGLGRLPEPPTIHRFSG